ncbi:MAG: HAD-IIIC family phosphatase [Lachnospiraceae bacterium]|nr:HAD-IIIC family phosphatase [Lachnospiraceae bacterium]
MKELEYPFDSQWILKKKKSIRRELIAGRSDFLKKKIAVLGGSTTHDILLILDLFLLNQGIQAEFYESEYNQYYQDAMFPNPKLEAFAPDFIYLYTTNRNITAYPAANASQQETEDLLDGEYQRFEAMWERLKDQYHCPMIQNNFEFPSYRLLGNQDAVYRQGRVSFLNRLNERFAAYARSHEGFYLLDLQYISARCGLDAWQDPFYWYMYKYALAVPFIPELSFEISKIIKSALGRNKKGLVLDLDNTLWGGVVGDEGPENLAIGQETPAGQAYTEFQQYLKELKNSGILLNVNSKNDMENALAGLKHPDAPLKPEDFILIKANWSPKDENFREIAQELNLLPESLVFLDDNPAEQALVKEQLPEVSVPKLQKPEEAIQLLDRSGFFETTGLSQDDLKRHEMYRENMQRSRQQAAFSNYEDFLRSLNMEAEIQSFIPIYLARIAQLTNKSNQFNLTTRRYTQDEITQIARDSRYLTLYGKLTDRFGDNGVVSVVIGRKEEEILHLELWIMSCRVLKRQMEDAMLDTLVERSRALGIRKLRGYYYPTAKNAMVKDFYSLQGFGKIAENEQGDTVWELSLTDFWEKKNQVIKVVEGT